MINLLIDTSNYRRDPRRSKSPFQTMTSLMQEGLIKLHVPDVIKREFTSQSEADVQQEFAEAVKQLRQLTKNPGLNAHKTYLEGVIEKLNSMQQQRRKEVRSDFSNWLERGNAAVHTPKAEHLGAVLDDYFAGNPPFKTAKSREDFLDSLIYQAAKGIVEEHGELYAIVHDNRLREAIGKLHNTKVFVTVEDFLKSDPIMAVYKDNIVRLRSREIIQILNDHEELVSDAVTSALGDELEGVEVNRISSQGEEDFSRIDAIEDEGKVTFHFSEASYLGGDIITVPFIAEPVVSLDAIVPRGDYFLEDENVTGEWFIWDWEHNEHYMHISEPRTLVVKGRVSVEVDSRKLGDDLKEEDVLKNSLARLDSIEQVKLVEHRR
jgi:hypothetical protein